MAGDCGSCTACCRVYAIPTLNKPAGAWCTHCDIGKGCKVYAQRPTLCSDFKCLWLQSQGNDDPRARMDANLRPDKSKVVFSPSTNETIIAAITMPGAPTAWLRPPVRDIISKMIKAGLRVVVGQPASLRKIMIDSRGTHEVEMTEPDENGMQWSKQDED